MQCLCNARGRGPAPKSQCARNRRPVWIVRLCPGEAVGESAIPGMAATRDAPRQVTGGATHRFDQHGPVESSTPSEIVDVEEVFDAAVADAERYDGLKFFGNHGFRTVDANQR